MPNDIEVSIEYPSVGQVLSRRSSHGFLFRIDKVLADSIFVWVPAITKAGWRIQRMSDGLFWDPEQSEFRRNASLRPYASRGADQRPAFDVTALGDLDDWTEGAMTTELVGGPQFDLADFPDGEYEFQVQAEIGSGSNFRAATAWVPFHVDNTEPVLTVDVPSAAGLAPGRGAILQGTVKDEVDLLALHVQIQDRRSGRWWRKGKWRRGAHPAINATPRDGTRWNVRFNGGASGSGAYTLKLLAVDNLGNTAEQTINFWSDLGPPALDIDQPDTATDRVRLTGRLRSPNHGLAQLTGAIEDRETGRSWNARRSRWEDAAVDATVRQARLDDSDVRFEMLFHALVAATEGGSGSYRATFTATDPPTFPGSSTTASVDFEVAAPDGAPPDTSIDNPSAGEQVARGTLTISGTASDDIDVARVDLAVARRYPAGGITQYWDDAAETFVPDYVEFPAELDADESWTAEIVADQPGEHSVTARSFDAIGNHDPTPAIVVFDVI